MPEQQSTQQTIIPRPTWRRRMFEWLFDHRAAVIVASIIVTIAGMIAGATIKWREDVMDLLPKSDPLIAQYQRILGDFGQLNLMLVEIGSPAGAAPLAQEELVAAGDRLAGAMEQSGLFKRLVYKMDVADFASALDVLRERRASLFTAEDEAALRERLRPESIRDILAGWKRQLTETPAPYVARQLARDPLGMDELLLRKISAAQSFDGPIRVEQGRLFSRDLGHILIMADPVHPSTDSFQSKALVDFMDGAVREAEQARPGRVQVAYLCGHRFGLENATRIKADVKLTLIITFAAIAVVSLLVYRRPLWVGLTFLPTFFGGAFALGMLRWLVPDISAIAIGCGSMLLGVAVDLGIHILYHIDQIDDARPRRDQIVEILDRLFWPLMLCSSTTIVAFLALEWSVLPGYQSLGHFAVFGFTGATIFAVCVLPLLVPLKRRGGSRPPLIDIARLFPPLFTLLARRRGIVLTLLVMSVPACLPGLLRLRFEGDYQKMNAVSPRVRSDMQRITTLFASAMPSTSLVVRGGDLEASLRQNEKLYAALKEMQRKGEVESVQSIAPLLPSAEAQQEAQRRWRAFWSPERTSELKGALEQAAAGLRIRPGAFAPFFAALTGPPCALTLDDLQGGVFQHLASLHVARAAEGVPVLTNLSLPPHADAEKVFGALRATGVPFISFHGAQLMEHIIRLIYSEMVWVSAITIALVVLILVAYYRAWRNLALILLPLLVGLFWTFAIMGWCDLRVNLMNSLIVVFVFGVVVDYSLFLATALGEARGPDDPHLAHSCVGIAVSALTTMIGLGVLVVAQHPALHSIGLTSLLGIGTGVLAVFLIIPLQRRG